MAKVDQRRFDNQHEDFLPAEAAARSLGVKVRTLYAYASRGLVTRVRAGKQSRYARADLDRLRARHDARAGHGPAAGGALHWGEPVLATSISLVTPDGPAYRGRPATQLVAEGRSFPEVCELLWTGALAAPSPAIAPLAGSRPDRQARAEEPLHRLVRVVVGALARDNLPEGVARSLELDRARALALALARAAGGGRIDVAEADPARSFLASHGVAPTAARRRLLDATLVLTADHELNASTFAARVAASTGADLHACVLAALAAFLGPRHGLASRRLEALLATLRRPADAAALVRSRTALGQEMPGFGHPLYPDGDPRARALLSLCARLTPGGRRAPLDALIAATERQRGQRPNIDAALVAVALGLGLPAGSAAVIFAVARVAGWVAHIFEQRASPAILRPRAQYVPS